MRSCNSCRSYLARQCGPAVGIPGNRLDAQLWNADLARIIGMIDHPIDIIFHEDTVVPGAFPLPIFGKNQRAAALGQRRAGTIHIGPSQLIAAPNPYIVGAVDALAALIERDEEIPVSIAQHDEWRFDGRCCIGAR